MMALAGLSRIFVNQPSFARANYWFHVAFKFDRCVLCLEITQPGQKPRLRVVQRLSAFDPASFTDKVAHRVTRHSNLRQMQDPLCIRCWACDIRECGDDPMTADANEIPPDMKTQMKRMWYHPICSDAEIDRVLAVCDAPAYLLNLRAETALDHMRILRVIRNFRRMTPDNWTLTGFFEGHQGPFGDYISLAKPKDVPPTYGFVFSNDPNASCLRSPFGDLITVSWSLKYFLQFMNIAYLDFGVDVPEHVALASQRIAIRTMLKTEALDFLMDPRGIVPPEIYEGLRQVMLTQLRFVFAHEYGHFALGHLNTAPVVKMPLFAALHAEEKEEKTHEHYNCSQLQELEADAYAISSIAGHDEGAARNTLQGGLCFFAYMDLYEQVADQMFPCSPWRVLSHPKPIDRINELLNQFGTSLGVTEAFIEPLLQSIAPFRDFFREDIATNVEAYEQYGSVYFDKPDTEWRGTELRDRRDYY